MIPEGVAVVGTILLVGYVIFAFAADARQKQALVAWATGRGGRAVGSGVCVPSHGLDVHVRRITRKRATEWTFSVRLARHLEPVKINAERFRPDISPAFRRLAMDPKLCESLAQLKGRRMGIRRPDGNERKSGVTGSYVYISWFGPMGEEQRNDMVSLVARLASLM